MAGVGLVWATPSIERLALSAQLAQVPSPLPDEVEGTEVTTEEEVDEEPLDEVLAEELPFTGIHAEQLIPLAGGLIATGAVALRLAKERRATPPTEDGLQT